MSGLQITAEQRTLLAKEKPPSSSTVGMIIDILLANAAPAVSERPLHQDLTEAEKEDAAIVQAFGEAAMAGIYEDDEPDLSHVSEPEPLRVICEACKGLGRVALSSLFQSVCQLCNGLGTVVREVPAPVPVGEECEACGRHEPYCDCPATTPSPPKFKVGDRVRVIETGEVKRIASVTLNLVYSTDDDCEYLADEIELATIELFDGAAFEGKYILKRVGDYWVWLYDGAPIESSRDIEQLVDWSKYTRDPSRDQHPVGSEWVSEDGLHWYLATIGLDCLGLIRAGGLGNHGPQSLNGWHYNIADATRGARRCDTIEIKLDK